MRGKDKNNNATGEGSGVLMLHKPKSFLVTRHDEKGRRTVFDLLPPWVLRNAWMPVGRLDRDTRGLLLFVQDPNWLEMLNAPGHIEKIYEAMVRGHVKQHHVDEIAKGIETPVGLLRARSITILGYAGPKTRVLLSLEEGKNRHIRRLFGALKDEVYGTPLKVVDLKRVQYGPIRLDVESGKWRFLKVEEIAALQSSVVKS